MSKELRNKERELFKQSMVLRRLDLSKTDWDQAQQIRKQQDEMWHKAQFYKKILTEIDKKNSESNSKE